MEDERLELRVVLRLGLVDVDGRLPAPATLRVRVGPVGGACDHTVRGQLLVVTIRYNSSA